MKTLIITTTNSGETLRIVEYNTIGEAKKFNRLNQARMEYDTITPTRIKLLKKGNVLEARTIPTGYRCYLFWDQELCDLELYPNSNQID